MTPANRIVLIGCGKTKREGTHEARDLYTGGLFRDRLRYVNQAIKRSPVPTTYIISALYGAIELDMEIESYDVTIKQLTKVECAAWSIGVMAKILDNLDDDAIPREIVLEIHAGVDYVDLLRDVAIALGFNVSTPLCGLGIGKQRAWYKSNSHGYPW